MAGKDGTSKEEFWRKTIARQLTSGLSQVKFCEQEKLNPNNFSFWKTTIKQRDEAKEHEVKRAFKQAAANRAARAEKASFIALVPATPSVKEAPSRTAVAEVEVAGARLRVFNGADCTTLCAIIRAMRESEPC